MSTADADKKILALYQQKGSREKAFDLLYTTYAERLYWHIQRMISDHNASDDILQDSLVKAWKGLEKFRGDAALYTWLYRIASNECLNYLQKEKRKNTHYHEDLTVLETEERSEEMSAGAEEIQDKLKRAIASLPEKQRKVFTMRYYEEMNYKEMSEILETSVGALKASFHHAVQKIEKFIRLTD